MVVTVDDLLREPFVNRTREQKVAIVLEGKPRPPLENLVSPQCDALQSSSSSFNNFIIYFDTASYDHIEWLTGCDSRQELFCWPCLLFRSAHEDSWNKNGLSDLSNFGLKIRQHEKSLLHIQSMLDLQLFISALETVETPAPEIKTDVPERNREIAKRIIDVISYLATQKNHPQNGQRNENVLKVEDCLQNLHFLRDYDVLIPGIIDETIEMVQKSPKIIDDMIQAIISVVKKEIGKELHNSTYVSLILSEHSTDCTKSQISTVLRYLGNGEVRERFVGFANIEGIKTFKIIYKLINQLINDFQMHLRVITYSVDGSVLSNTEALNDLKRELQFRYPRINFVPCHFHDLDDVLLKSLSYSSECNFFIKLISIVMSFFQEGANVCLKFEGSNDFKVNNPHNMQNCNDIQPTPKNCYSNYSAYLNCIKIHRLSIIKELNEALANAHKLTGDDVVKIKAVCAFLSDCKNIFHLETLLKLFDDVAPLVEAFKSSFPGLAFDTNLIKSIFKSLEDDGKVNAIDAFFTKFVQNFYKTTKKKDSLLLKKKDSCCKFFLDMVLRMESQIRFRFQDASKFYFCHILDFEHSAISFSADDIQTLISNFGQAFDYKQLAKEIKILNENKSLPHESVHKLYKFFSASDLRMTFKNINRICELVLALPSTKPSVTNKSMMTKLDEINFWSFSSCRQHSRDMSLLCIEQEYLTELRKKESFYNDVIHEFYQINKILKLF